MNVRFKSIFLTLVLFFSAIVTSLAFAQQNIDKLRSLEQEINKDPYGVYQQIEKIKDTIQVTNNNELLWFYIRKAQAEYLLHFTDKLENTVAEGKLLLRPDSNDEIKAYMHLYAGMVESRNANYTVAIELFEQAIVDARRAKNIEIYVTARQELAFNRSVIEQFESSLVDLQQAYYEAKALDNIFLLSTVYESYGALYGYMNKYDQSIEYYQKALEGYKSLGYKPYIAEAIYGIASTYRYQEKFDLAIKYFSEYNNYTNYTPAKSITFFGYYGLGITLAEKGDCQEALAVIEEGLIIGGLVDYEAELYKRQAICLAKMQQFDKAVKAIDKAESILIGMEELHGTAWIIEIDKNRAEVAELAGDYEKSLHYYKTYLDKQIKLIERNSSNKVNALRIELESDRQKVEIDLLKEQARVQELLVSRQREKNTYQGYILASGTVILLIVILFVIKQIRSNRRLVNASQKDSLAECYNRHYTFSYLQSCIDKMSDKGNLSIILFDIDNFKQINDRYGHPAGDKVIRAVAQIADSILRPGDIIGRIGGEEYLCVLNRVNSQQCADVAKRMLCKINQQDISIGDGSTLNVTVSMGTADYSAEKNTAQKLYVDADKAMYQAKRTGKNRIVKFVDIDS